MTRPAPPLLLGAALALGALAGCAEFNSLINPSPTHVRTRTISRIEKPQPKSEPRNEARSEARNDARAEVQPGADQAALRDGIRLYNEGDFNGAIKRLGSNDIRAGSPARIRVAALKYTAFSYCVTSRPKQCEQAFEKALKIDPDFTLEPGEQGHPLWGPAYERAKRD